MNRVISMDVDGVLLDWHTHAYYRLGLKIPEKITSWMSPGIEKHWDTIDTNPIFWENLPKITDPKKFAFKPDHYLTSIPKRYTKSRKDNLKKHGFWDIPVIVSDNKIKFLKNKFSDSLCILIDDKPDTIKEAEKEKNVICIQYIPPYAHWGELTDKVAYNEEDLNKLISEI
jgi:hypothetical protein